MCRKIVLVLGAVIVAAAPLNASAQTGTRIRDGGGKQPQTVVWFSEPHEITDIRLLLQAGHKQQAVDKALWFVAEMRKVAGEEARVRLYYGLCALCAALTSAGVLPEAATACTEAIGLYPTRWQALNNRGVAYYASGQIDQALGDYRRALAAVRDSEPLTEMIQHNIDLAEAKRDTPGS